MFFLFNIEEWGYNISLYKSMVFSPIFVDVLGLCKLAIMRASSGQQIFRTFTHFFVAERSTFSFMDVQKNVRHLPSVLSQTNQKIRNNDIFENWFFVKSLGTI